MMRCWFGHQWKRAGKIRTVKCEYSVSGGWASWLEVQQRLLVCARCGKEEWQTYDRVRHNSNLRYDVQDAEDAIRKREGVTDDPR